MSENDLRQIATTSVFNQGNSAMVGFQALDRVKKLSESQNKINNQVVQNREDIKNNRDEIDRIEEGLKEYDVKNEEWANGFLPKISINETNIAKNIRNLGILNKKVESVNKEQSKYTQKEWDNWSDQTNEVLAEHKKLINKNTDTLQNLNIKKLQEDTLRKSKIYSDKVNAGIQNQINQSIEQQKETDIKQDELLKKLSESEKKNNEFNTENYVTKFDFNKSKDALKFIPQNINSIISLESKNNELEQKIDSKLDSSKLSNDQTILDIKKNMEDQRNRFNGFKLTNESRIQGVEQKVESKLDGSQLPNNVTIKQIQQDLNSKLSSQDLIPLSQNVNRLDGLVNTNTKNINDANKKLDQKMNKSDLLNFDAKMFREQKNNMRKVQDDLDGLEQKIESKLDRDSLVNEPTIKSLQQQIGTKLSSQDLSNNIKPINQTIASLQQQIGTKLSSQDLSNNIKPINQTIASLQNTTNENKINIKKLQEDLQVESKANSIVLRTNGNNIADIQRKLISKNNVISKNTQDITKGLESISKLNEVNRIYGEDLKNLDFFSRKTNEVARQNETNIKNQKNQNVTFDVFMRGNNQKIQGNISKINSNKEDIQFLNKTYNQELTRLETNIKKNNDETKLNIKNIQESLNKKIKTNSEDIEDVRSILPALNNSTNKVKAQAKTNSDSIKEMKEQNAKVRTNVNTKLLKQTSDIRMNTDSINELRNTTLKQLQQESSKNKQNEIERQNRIKQLSNVKDNVEKQLRNLKSLVALNSSSISSMDKELQKQKLLNLVYLNHITKMKKNPFFNLKM